MGEINGDGRKITTYDITGKVEEKSANMLGDAHEHFVAAIGMRLGLDCAIAEYSSEEYDLLLAGYEYPPKEHKNPKKKMLKIQVKSGTNSMSLSGGSRGGIDREYVSDVKEYQYTSENVDAIVAVNTNNLDVYILPAEIAEEFGKSKAFSKLQPVKNRWDLFVNWRPEYRQKVRDELPDFV